MVGSGKEYRNSLELAEEECLLGTILTMLPAVEKEEVPGLLAALDVAVLPGSTDIICPIKVQEYMACGLPAVVPDYVCNREVIDDGRTGLLFRPGDECDLAEKISELASDPVQREVVGFQARQEVHKRFTWESTWGAVLSGVIGKVSL